jgi:hypothetical protein
MTASSQNGQHFNVTMLTLGPLYVIPVTAGLTFAHDDGLVRSSCNQQEK